MKILKRIKATASAPRGEKRGSFKVKFPEIEFFIVKTPSGFKLSPDMDVVNKLSEEYQKKCSQEAVKILKKQPEWDSLDSYAQDGYLGSSTGFNIPYDVTFWFKD